MKTSKQLLDRRKDSLLLLHTYTSSTSTLGLLLHVQYYQRCKPMISKIWGKVNLFRHNQLIDWKRIFLHVFEVLIFLWKRTVTVNLKKVSSNTIFRWYTFGEFYIVKFNYFSERPNTVNKRFWNIFDWKISLVSTKTILH